MVPGNIQERFLRILPPLPSLLARTGNLGARVETFAHGAFGSSKEEISNLCITSPPCVPLLAQKARNSSVTCGSAVTWHDTRRASTDHRVRYRTLTPVASCRRKLTRICPPCPRLARTQEGPDPATSGAVNKMSDDQADRSAGSLLRMFRGRTWDPVRGGIRTEWGNYSRLSAASEPVGRPLRGAPPGGARLSLVRLCGGSSGT